MSEAGEIGLYHYATDYENPVTEWPPSFGRETDYTRYIRHDLHLAALQAARIEGYEIARKEAAAMGCHLLRPDLVPALTQKPPE